MDTFMEQTSMTSEPFDCSQDVSADFFIDFDESIFETGAIPLGFDVLTLSQGHEQFDPSESSSTNANHFVPSVSQTNDAHGTQTASSAGHHADVVRSESTASSPRAIQDIVDLLLEMDTTNSSTSKPVNAQLSVQAIENELRKGSEKFLDGRDAQAVKTAINRRRQPVMRMKAQPVARQRFRYGVEGRRFLKNSRGKPMSIKLPRLAGCLTKPCQSLWIQGTLVTTRENPYQKVFLHQHAMQYNGGGAQQNGSKSFRIRLTDKNILQRIKKLERTSIIKTKLRNYSFELIPFDPMMPGDHPIRYTTNGEEQLTQVQKAKRFDEEHHTEQFRIVWQLMLKQNDQWYPMDINCETRIITDA